MRFFVILASFVMLANARSLDQMAVETQNEKSHSKRENLKSDATDAYPAVFNQLLQVHPQPQAYAAPLTYAAPTAYQAPVQPVTYEAPVQPVAYAPKQQLFSTPVTYAPKPQPQLLITPAKQVHYAPLQPQILAPAPEPIQVLQDPYLPQNYNPETAPKSTYGPPGHTPPPMITNYEPVAKYTDVLYNHHVDEPLHTPAPQPLILKAPEPIIVQNNPHPVPVIKQAEPAYYQHEGYGRTIKHVYVHAAPDEPVEKQTRFIRPKSNPDVHYQIIFVKTPTPQVAEETLIELPPQPKQKTVVYLLSRRPHLHNDVKVVAPPPTQPSQPEVHFIRYAKDVPSYPVVKENYHHHQPLQLAPAPVLLQAKPEYSHAAVYAPQMEHTLYAPPAPVLVQSQPQLLYNVPSKATQYKRETNSNEKDEEESEVEDSSTE